MLRRWLLDPVRAVGVVSAGSGRGSALLEFRAVAVDRAGEFSDVDREDCARMATELGQLLRDMVRMDVAAEAAF
eukprot:17816-Chlamydomonas_euryale.AAC.1